MKVVVATLVAFVLALCVVSADEPKVGSLPPHQLDKAFERANSAGDITNALLNDPLFKKAVQAAAKAKAEQAEAHRKKPGLMAPTPAQAARKAFIAVLLGDDPADSQPPPK